MNAAGGGSARPVAGRRCHHDPLQPPGGRSADPPLANLTPVWKPDDEFAVRVPGPQHRPSVIWASTSPASYVDQASYVQQTA